MKPLPFTSLTLHSGWLRTKIGNFTQTLINAENKLLDAVVEVTEEIGWGGMLQGYELDSNIFDAIIHET